MSPFSALTRHKTVQQLQAELGQRKELRRVLGVWQLTSIGLGGIIGVGIFVLAGQQAAANAGPAVAIAFIIAGIASGAAALCYAEFAGLIPVTGSAYTYGYAVLGEFVAWLIGWDLLLEYALIVAAVASGWSGYMQNILEHFGLGLPLWAQGAIGTGKGHVFNLIAALVAIGVAVLLTARTEVGARLNTIVVAAKIVGVALVIIVGAFFIDPSNWVPFVPEEVIHPDGTRQYGWHGVTAAAAVVFFAVFGYDTLTTAAEESRNPQRDLPRAILLSLGISMLLYLTISMVLTGVAHYTTLDNPAPVANAFGGVRLESNTGVYTFDLGLAVQNDGDTGLSIFNSGTVNVTGGANVNTIDTANASAILSSGTLVDMTFQSVSSTNAPANGILITGMGGSFTVTGLGNAPGDSSIQTVRGHGFAFRIPDDKELD